VLCTSPALSQPFLFKKRAGILRYPPQAADLALRLHLKLGQAELRTCPALSQPFLFKKRRASCDTRPRLLKQQQKDSYSKWAMSRLEYRTSSARAAHFPMGVVVSNTPICFKSRPILHPTKSANVTTFKCNTLQLNKIQNNTKTLENSNFQNF
jgi:hypothetical protein